MAVITRIRGWTDPGFTEGGPEAPNTVFSLPSATVDLQNLTVVPSAGRFFSEFKLGGVAWNSWRSMSFLEITYEWNNTPATTKLYGFVDDVELVSDTNTLPAIRVQWHVDEWMTYLGSASLGFGHVLRRPVGSDDPIQSYERKYWLIDQYTDLLDETELSGRRTYWVLLAVGATDNTHKLVKYYTFPFALDDHQYYALNPGDGVARSVPKYSDIVEGRWDELLDLDPQAIYGAWVLPVPPFDPSGLTEVALGIEVDVPSWTVPAQPLGTAAAIVSDSAPLYQELFYKKNKTFSPSKVSTELNPLRITSFTGEVVGEIPVGMTVTGYDYRVVASATECYIDIRFNGGWYAKLEGIGVTIPALVLDLTENAWSSYQYSGQREYDIDSRNNESLKNGVQSITSGGMTGALMGGFGPMGAAAGAVGGTIAGAASMGMDFLWYNNAAQGAKDKLAATQTPGILISGGALDAINHGHDIALCKMKMDTYSKDRADAERSLVGVKVDEYISSNDSVRASSGYYQIAELAVKGSIPEAAKRMISQRFAKGVKLI